MGFDECYINTWQWESQCLLSDFKVSVSGPSLAVHTGATKSESEEDGETDLEKPIKREQNVGTIAWPSLYLLTGAENSRTETKQPTTPWFLHTCLMTGYAQSVVFVSLTKGLWGFLPKRPLCRLLLCLELVHGESF